MIFSYPIIFLNYVQFFFARVLCTKYLFTIASKFANNDHSGPFSTRDPIRGLHLVLVIADSDLTLNFRADLDEGDILRLDGVVGHLAELLSLAVAVHGNSLRVGEALIAGAAGDDDVAEVALVGGVLVEDLVPVARDAAEAAGDDLVKDANLARLGKVLHPVGAAVAGGRVGVLVVVALPLVAAGEGRAVLGERVPVQAVGHFVQHGTQVGRTLDDAVTGRVGEGSSTVVETRRGDKVAVEKNRVSYADQGMKMRYRAA